MKTSIKSTSKILAVFFFSFSAMAGSVGRIATIKGHVFTISQGETKVLKAGDELNSGTDLITEEGSQVTFNDFADHTYNLSGSGHMTLKNKEFELKRGYLWVQSFNAYTTAEVKTANAVTSFKRSEFILSFDNNSGRSQILAVNGPIDFLNFHERNLMRTLETGHFSFVDKDYEQGMPRKGTLIGYQSFMKIAALFDNVKPLDGSVIAVIKNQSPQKKLDVKEEGLARELASIGSVKESKKKVWKKKAVETPEEKIQNAKIYGLQTEMLETMTPVLQPVNKRIPASIATPEAAVIQNQFEQSFKAEEIKQPRHESDVNRLIDDLKSYQSDFNKEY